MTDNDWISEHFEVGKVTVGWDHGRVLACRHCGSFVWDTEKHMAALHQTAMGNVTRNLPPRERE